MEITKACFFLDSYILFFMMCFSHKLYYSNLTLGILPVSSHAFNWESKVILRKKEMENERKAEKFYRIFFSLCISLPNRIPVVPFHLKLHLKLRCIDTFICGMFLPQQTDGWRNPNRLFLSLTKDPSHAHGPARSRQGRTLI